MRLNKLPVLILSSLIAVFILLAFRCYYIQVIRSPHYRSILDRQETVTVSESAQRGVIVDTRGRYIAVSEMDETVYADPAIIDDYKEVASRLQDILDIPGHELCKLLYDARNKRFLKIKDRITPQQRELIKNERIYGIGIQSRWRRNYPMGSLFCHVVGIEASTKNWSEGVERWYYDLLQGISGTNTFLVDTFRKPIGLSGQCKMPVIGTSMVLTLDSTIQKFSRDALFAKCREYEAQSGIAIVMNPHNGEVLALTCYPEFDPENLSDDPEKRRNRALTDPYEPGSIFKPVFTAISMDLDVINKNTQIDCEHGSYHGKGFGRIGEYAGHSYGNLTPKEILAHSSNIGMAKMGQIFERKYGKQKMYEEIRLFGFGEKTGIDLPGECSGILSHYSKWNGYSITRIPYGQEISVTAMQIAKAYCILANGGRPVIPHVAKAFVDSNGQTIKINNIPSQAGYIIKPEIAKWIVKNALTEVVKEGTGKKAALENYEVWGKTGTANIAVNGHYDDRSYVASFAGGAPADNPQVVVLVSIYKPNRSLGKGYTGGTVTAPVAGEIIKNTLDYLNKQR